MKLNEKSRDTMSFFLFAAPWLIGLLWLTLIPMAASLIISFTQWDLLTSPKWFGFGNYITIFTDPLFYKSVQVTFTFTIFSVPLNVIVSVFVALLLNNKIRGMTMFRTIFYLPAVVSGVVVSIIWLWMFNPDFGIINNMLHVIGIQGPKWVYDEHWAMPSLVIMSLWNVGGSIIIYLAALQSISTELYEASHIDGAGWWKRFFNITLPGISPMILFTTLTGIISAIQTFTSAFIMTNGGPNNSTMFYAFYIYNNAFIWHKMGEASAQAWIMFIMIFIISYLCIRVSNRYVYYDAKEGGDII
jgi:multiple sugar transport system permease protein